LPLTNAVAHLEGELDGRRVVRRAEHEVAQSAADSGSHRTLDGIRRDDDRDRVFDLADPTDQGDATELVERRREGPTRPDEVSSCVARRHRYILHSAS